MEPTHLVRWSSDGALQQVADLPSANTACRASLACGGDDIVRDEHPRIPSKCDRAATDRTWFGHCSPPMVHQSRKTIRGYHEETLAGICSRRHTSHCASGRR